MYIFCAIKVTINLIIFNQYKNPQKNKAGWCGPPYIRDVRRDLYFNANGQSQPLVAKQLLLRRSSQFVIKQLFKTGSKNHDGDSHYEIIKGINLPKGKFLNDSRNKSYMIKLTLVEIRILFSKF